MLDVAIILRGILLAAALGSMSAGTAIAQAGPPDQTGPSNQAGAENPQISQPKTFIIYFDAGSTRISRAMLPVVEDAASAIKRGQERTELSHVKVIGYSDTVGSVDTAQILSQERAASVRDELVHNGVAPDFITVEGRGKQELAIVTADQVDQPRNRRVRIILYRPGD